MSIFTIEPYESLTEKGRKKDTIIFDLNISEQSDETCSIWFDRLKQECEAQIIKKTKDFINVVETGIELDSCEDYSYDFEVTVHFERDETREEYFYRRQNEINKIKRGMNKEEVRRIEEADRLKKEYDQYLKLQEKFKNFDPATLDK